MLLLISYFSEIVVYVASAYTLHVCLVMFELFPIFQLPIIFIFLLFVGVKRLPKVLNLHDYLMKHYILWLFRWKLDKIPLLAV